MYGGVCVERARLIDYMSGSAEGAWLLPSFCSRAFLVS